MRAIEIMERCRAASSEINELREKIDRLRDGVNRMTQALDGIGGRGTSESDRFAAVMAEIDEVERTIEARVLQYSTEMMMACTLLDMLPERERRIADRYYLQGRSLKQISRELHYSYSYVRSGKGAAVAMLSTISDVEVYALTPDEPAER